MPQYGGRERGNMKRVVITGLGTVNPLGSTVEKFWENIKKGTLGVSKIDSFDTTELGVSVAGIIRDFDPAEYFDRKDIRHMERFTQIAVASAIQHCRMPAQTLRIWIRTVSVRSSAAASAALAESRKSMTSTVQRARDASLRSLSP